LVQLAGTVSIGDATTGPSDAGAVIARAASAEAQFRSCRGPLASAWSGRAVSRRALELLPREPVEPSRDVHACLFPMCGRPPLDAGVLDLNVTKRAECEARHTSKSFLRIRPRRSRKAAGGHLKSNLALPKAV